MGAELSFTAKATALEWPRTSAIFNVQRHLIRRATLRRFRAEAHQAWNGATAAA